MATLAEIIPKFPKLRRIDLPSYLLSEDDRANLIQKMKFEVRPVEVSFSDPLEDSMCFFLQE